MPRKIRCTVDAVISHGGRVYTVDVVPSSPVTAFRAGQFLHLSVDAYDPSGFWPDSRVFSIASSPRDRSLIRICYSVKGGYTEKMERTLRKGVQVWVKLPYGDFVIDDTQDAVLIAGGTGISAFTAFIEALGPSASRTVRLVYGARTPDLWLFREMIERQASTCPCFSALLFAESGLPGSCPLSGPGPLTSDIRPETSDCRPRTSLLLSGRISLAPLFASCMHPPPSTNDHPSVTSDRRSLTSDQPPAIFYLSGPPAMLTAFTTDLIARGVPADRVRTDAWE